MRSNHELSAVVLDLQRLDCPNEQVDVLAVGRVLTEHAVTTVEFIHLDEEPGAWGYRPGGLGEWHYKLRTFRNSGAIRSYIFTKETS